jgi:hypothetical protein
MKQFAQKAVEKANREASTLALKALLSIDTNAKTVKGQTKGFLTGILYLAPVKESGAINVCPHASKGCAAACLFTAGRGAFDNVRNARIAKTLAFVRDRAGFMATLANDVAKLAKKAEKQGMTPCVRLNGTSDLPWENIACGESRNIMEAFPSIQFYDYTKNPNRIASYLSGEMPKNYHLTFSRSEDNGQIALSILKSGGNVAMVFSSANLPPQYEGAIVVNGDETDLRFLDPQGCIVGLKAKGKARKDDSGFVVHA